MSVKDGASAEGRWQPPAVLSNGIESRLQTATQRPPLAQPAAASLATRLPPPAPLLPQPPPPLQGPAPLSPRLSADGAASANAAAGPPAEGRTARDCEPLTLKAPWDCPDLAVLDGKRADNASLVDDEDEGGDALPSLRVPAFEGWAVLRYLPPCLLGTGGSSALTVALWSAIGAGETVLGVLEDNYHLRFVCLGFALAVLLALYLLDFFWPPHLPGRTFALWEGDRAVGATVLAFSMVLLVFYVMLLAKEHPSLPMFTTIFLSPLLLATYRYASGKRRELPANKFEVVGHGSAEEREQLRQLLHLRHRDKASYLYAAFFSFIACSAGTLAAFLVWIATGKRSVSIEYQHEEGLASGRLEAAYTLWAAPVVVAVANAVLAAVVLFRILAHEYYVSTDPLRAAMEDAEAASQTPSGSVAMRSRALGAAAGAAAAAAGPAGPSLAPRPAASAAARWRARAPRRGLPGSSGSPSVGDRAVRPGAGGKPRGRRRDMQPLPFMLKVAASGVLFMMACTYFVFKMLYANRAVAALATNFLLLFFVIFVLFSYVAFRRIVDAAGKSLVELPLWKRARSIVQNDWTKAVIVCQLLVAVPLVLLLSSWNQWVRRKRGIAPWIEQRPWSVLTPRVAEGLVAILDWDRFSILFKCYCLCFVYLLLKLVPILLNVMLAWMTEVLKRYFSFWVIVVLVFGIGVIAFMLPPVPGMTIYLFGGLVLSNPATCPYGFWGGAVLNIFMCWFLKLAASAVQQKLIGEALGRRMWVRQLAGVHKVTIRCLEAIMRKPGLSLGKIAILCGGPDWPVSVLAGMLRLNLLQCMLGTTPIILFVTPCALSGSFYLKRSISEDEQRTFWSQTASMMLVTSVGVSVLLMGVIGWSVQRELETNHRALSCKLRENADLEWLDHQDAELKKACHTPWSLVPVAVRRLFLAGAAVQILVCDAFGFSSSLVGEFHVYDGLQNLRWCSDESGDGIFTPYAIAALASYSCAWLCPVPYILWKRRASRRPRESTLARLLAEKEAWLAAYAEQAEAEVEPSTPRSGGRWPTRLAPASADAAAQQARPADAVARAPSADDPAPSARHRPGAGAQRAAAGSLGRRRPGEGSCGSREARLPEEQERPRPRLVVLAARAGLAAPPAPAPGQGAALPLPQQFAL